MKQLEWGIISYDNKVEPMNFTIRKAWMIIIPVLLVISTLFIVITFPQKRDMTLTGIVYQSGNGNDSFEREVNLRIEGKFKKSLWGKHKFQGYFDIQDERFSLQNEQTYIEIAYQKNKPAVLGYVQFNDEGDTNLISFGDIFINEDFTAFTILLTYIDGQQTEWNHNHGYVLSAPVKDHEEAIHLTRKLTKGYLD